MSYPVRASYGEINLPEISEKRQDLSVTTVLVDECSYKAIDRPELRTFPSSHLPGDGRAVRWRRRENERRIQCELCSQTFTRKADLLVHRRKSHSGIKYHHCNICKKGFGVKQSLDRHVATVHQLLARKIHQCEVCNRRFARADNLLKHKRVHDGLRPFECGVCKRKFNRRDNMNAHMNSVHVSLNTHPCDRCRHFFGSKDELRFHRNSIHGVMKSRQCDICGRTFTRSDHLVRHQKAVHRSDGSTCMHRIKAIDSEAAVCVGKVTSNYNVFKADVGSGSTEKRDCDMTSQSDSTYADSEKLQLSVRNREDFAFNSVVCESVRLFSVDREDCIPPHGVTTLCSTMNSVRSVGGPGDTSKCGELVWASSYDLCGYHHYCCFVLV